MTARLATDRSTPPLPDRPVAELAYLVFVFVPLLFWHGFPASALWAGVAACAVFLPMHFAFHRDMPRRRWMIAAVAALGFVLIPFNPGGNTFVIYAIAMSAATLRPRLAIVLGLALLAATAVEFLLVIPNRALAFGYVLMVAVIGTMVLGGVLFARDRERRNAELRLSNEEVARLAALAERERIGRDLHDLLGHTLSLVAL